MRSGLTRRRVLRGIGISSIGLALAACQPNVVTEEVEKVVTETAIVEVATLPEGALRQLSGKITVGTEGVLPVEGAPLTKRQGAWQTVLTMYKESQPNVEVIIQDLPLGVAQEAWCEAGRAGNTMPDISMVGNCNYFQPSPEEIAAGRQICRNFKPYEDEINPYTGKPWREDWFSDFVRLGRGQVFGAYDYWPNMTEGYTSGVVWVNLDILNEYGYDDLPNSLTELWELSARINADGKYVAWDDTQGSYLWYAWAACSPLVLKEYEAAGGDISSVQGMTDSFGKVFSPVNMAEMFCTKKWWASESPALQEGLKQVGLFVQAHGDGASYLDPTREVGKLWLTGRAAFSFWGSWFWGGIVQAREDGVLNVPNFKLSGWPSMTKNDLINKDLDIAFDGAMWLISLGHGDTFAPLPKVRASGEDPNVDLIVLDFLQFLSSPPGQHQILEQNLIPVNPITIKLVDPALQKVFDLRRPEFEKMIWPLGQMANSWTYQHDPEKSFDAWLRGELDFETAIRRADENITIELVKRIEDDLEGHGLTELPEWAKEWRR